MILSDTEVWERIQNGIITIDPKPSQPNADSSVWQSMALDIHLGERVYKIRSKEAGGSRIAIDLADYKTDEFATQYWEQVDQTPDGYFPIHPKEFRLAYTKEKVQLPIDSRICAVVEGKSGLARIGLNIHLAPVIHCGFGEESPQPIMLEIYNHSENVIYLRPGIKICQFVFQQVHGYMASRGAKTHGRNQPQPIRIAS